MPDTSRPAAGFDAYITGLLDALGDRDPLQVLSESPAALRRGIAGMSEQQLSTGEAAGKWSVRQLLAHLADSDLVGAFRFRMILSHDRPPIPAYDQDLWARQLGYESAGVAESLETFTAVRQANLRLLEAATPEQRERVGIHSERGPESLGFLIRIYAGHDLVHLRQLARIRAAIGA